jgi:hypothetical protein
LFCTRRLAPPTQLSQIKLFEAIEFGWSYFGSI